jgi:hypothetical protein
VAVARFDELGLHTVAVQVLCASRLKDDDSGSAVGAAKAISIIVRVGHREAQRAPGRRVAEGRIHIASHVHGKRRDGDRGQDADYGNGDHELEQRESTMGLGTHRWFSDALESPTYRPNHQFYGHW